MGVSDSRQAGAMETSFSALRVDRPCACSLQLSPPSREMIAAGVERLWSLDGEVGSSFLVEQVWAAMVKKADLEVACCDQLHLVPEHQ